MPDVVEKAVFSEPEEDDLEVVVVKEGEVEEKKGEEGEIRVKREEFEELKRQGDAATRLAERFGAFAEGIKGQPQAQVPVNAPGFRPPETDDEFYRKMEEESFKPGQFGKVMKSVVAREAAPLVAEMRNQSLATARQLLRADPDRGEVFRKYEKEIEQKVQAIPHQYRFPGMYEQALKEVLVERQPEIVQEQVEKRVDDMVKKVLREKYGIDPDAEGEGKAKARGPAVQSLGQGRGGGSVQEDRKVLRITEGDRRAMLERGLDARDPDQVRSWLKRTGRA